MADTDTETGSSIEEPTPTVDEPKPDIPAEVKSALRKANKEAETLRLKLKEIEDRDKTEQQKALDRAEAAERELATERAARLRLTVAAEFGLSDVADAIAGSTEDEIRANAERLAGRTTTPPKSGLTSRPKPEGPRATVAAGPTTEKDKAVSAFRQLGANR